MSPKKSQIDLLKQYFELGVGILLATSFAVLKVPRFIELFNINIIHGIGTLLLVIATFIWLGGWIYFDQREIQLLEDYVETEKMRRIKFAPFVSIIFIAILSGLLLGLADQPRFFIMVALINWIFSTFGVKISREHLKSVSEKDEAYQTGVRKLICDYYFYRPFILLDCLIFGYLIIALVLAWYAYISGNQFDFYLSYSILIVAIFIHEGVLWKWRSERDKSIDEIENKLLDENN